MVPVAVPAGSGLGSSASNRDTLELHNSANPNRVTRKSRKLVEYLVIIVKDYVSALTFSTGSTVQ